MKVLQNGILRPAGLLGQIFWVSPPARKHPTAYESTLGLRRPRGPGGRHRSHMSDPGDCCGPDRSYMKDRRSEASALLTASLVPFRNSPRENRLHRGFTDGGSAHADCQTARLRICREEGTIRLTCGASFVAICKHPCGTALSWNFGRASPRIPCGIAP